MRDITPQLNVLSILGIFFIIVLATIFEFVYRELPCPLCLLQRLGLLGMGIGFLMNLRYGARAKHYAVSLFFALFTASVAIRQIIINLNAPSGGYGDPFLGLHLYTWVLIIAFLYIVWIGINMLFEKHFSRCIPIKASRNWKIITHVLFAMMAGLVLFETVVVLFECGISQCPENPTVYKLMQYIR